MRSTQTKIVQVTSYYPPHLGGMENCVKKIAENLAGKGCSVEVFTSGRGLNHDNKSNSNNLRVHYLNSIEFAHTPIIFNLFFRLLNLPKKSVIHLHISQAFIPEIVYLVSKIKGIPYVAHIHLDVDSSGKMGFLLKPYKRYILKPVLHHASKIICLTGNQKQAIKQKYDLNETKMVVVPNGVGEEYFVKREIYSKDPLHILFVGRLAKQKNIPLLLESTALLKNRVIVNIVGDGEEAQNLKNLAFQLRLENVLFHGKKTGEELKQFYKKADIFLMTSRSEGMSLALLEAMASGLPIIVPDISGAKDLLDDAAVFIKDTRPEIIAGAIDNLIFQPDYRKKLSEMVQKRAKKYTWDTITNSLLSIYKNIAYEK